MKTSLTTRFRSVIVLGITLSLALTAALPTVAGANRDPVWCASEIRALQDLQVPGDTYCLLEKGAAPVVAPDCADAPRLPSIIWSRPGPALRSFDQHPCPAPMKEGKPGQFPMPLTLQHPEFPRH